jgi:glycerophosphoryl diester phosphodiesterase
MRRIGHKGADLVVPGNTPASFDKAIELGVHMIEFDVLPEDPRAPESSRLLLAHDYEGGLDGAHTLEEGLSHLAGLDADLDVDLKLPGYEERVVELLREHDLLERALVSSTYMRSLVRVRELEPGLRLGWSVPRARRDYTDSWAYKLPALAVLLRMRRRFPAAAAAHLRAGRIDAVMSHWRLVSRSLVEAIHAAGGELYVWTVDDAARIARLEALGVDGVITNDPRLFGPGTARA